MPGGGSDRTLKKNVMTINDSLSKVTALRPVAWNWKTEPDTAELKYGFIAQEVAEVMPHLVSDGIWEDGTTRKFLTMEGMIPYLVGAIQAQQRQIDQLRREVEQHEAKSPQPVPTQS